VKFLRNSFDVIETIDSDDEFDPFEATTEGGNSLDDSVLCEGLWRRMSSGVLREAEVTRFDYSPRGMNWVQYRWGKYRHPHDVQSSVHL